MRDSRACANDLRRVEERVDTPTQRARVCASVHVHEACANMRARCVEVRVRVREGALHVRALGYLRI